MIGSFIVEGVECPICEAGVGMKCNTRNGRPHDERIDIADLAAAQEKSGRRDATYEKAMAAAGKCHECGGSIHGGRCDPREDEGDDI